MFRRGASRYSQRMTNQQSWPQPVPPAKPSAVQTALMVAALPAAIGLLGFATDLFAQGLQPGGVVSAFFNTLLGPIVFAAVAAVSLAFIKPVRLDGPLSVVATPVLIAAGIGAVALIIFRYIYAAVLSAIDSGVAHSPNIASVIATAISYTVLLALAAVFLRSRLWGAELAAGAPAPHDQAISALIVAGVVLIEPIVITTLSSVFLLQYGMLFSVVGLTVVKSILFAGVTFIVLMFVRPLFKIGTLPGALAAVGIIAALGLVVELIVTVIVGIVDDNMDHFFSYTIISAVWQVVERSLVAALALLVVLAVRGQRVLMGRVPRPQAPFQQPQYPHAQYSQQPPAHGPGVAPQQQYPQPQYGQPPQQPQFQQPQYPGSPYGQHPQPPQQGSGVASPPSDQQPPAPPQPRPSVPPQSDQVAPQQSDQSAPPPPSQNDQGGNR